MADTGERESVESTKLLEAPKELDAPARIDDVFRSDVPRQRPWSTGVDVPLPEEAGFTPWEHWAWERIIRGQIADMSLYEPGENDPDKDVRPVLSARSAYANDRWSEEEKADYAKARELCQWRRALMDSKPEAVRKAIEDASEEERKKLSPEQAQVLEEFQEDADAVRAKVEEFDALEDAYWPAWQTLSEAFLRTVLFHDPWASAIDGSGIRIFHARVTETLNWSARTTFGQLVMHSCRFERELIWQRMSVRGLCSLQGSTLAGGFSGDGLMAPNGFFCRWGFVVHGDLGLNGARIGSTLDLDKATVNGVLRGDGLWIEGSLFCRRAKLGADVVLVAMNCGSSLQFVRSTIAGSMDISEARIGKRAALGEAVIEGRLTANNIGVEENLECQSLTSKGGVMLSGAKIGGQLNLNQAKLNGGLYATGISVQQSMFLAGGFEVRGRLDLIEAKIGGMILFGASTIGGELSAHSMRVDGMMFLRNSTMNGDVNFGGAKFHSDLQLRESRINGNVDLTGARIDGELHLEKDAEKPGPTWGPKATLILRNTKVGALAGSIGALERKITKKKTCAVPCDLSGFRYERLGGLGAEPGSTLASAPVGRLKRLLRTRAHREDKSFDSQPYVTLATALDGAGRPAKANRIRISANNHELFAHGTRLTRRISLALSWLFVGYGLRNWRAAALFLLTILAAASFGAYLTSAWRDPDDLARWFWFATDSAVPVVELDASHAQFLAKQLNSSPGEEPVGVVSVFNGLKVLGLISLTYLAAGLTGIAVGARESASRG